MIKNQYTSLKVVFLFFIFFISIFLGIMFGSTGLLVGDVVEVKELLFLRLPRVVLALLTGGVLAICGAALQSILENPLAEPFLLGVSGGSVLGGTIFIVLSGLFGDSIFGIRFFSFVGAIGALILLLYVNQRQGVVNPINILLTGVIFNGFVSSIVTIFKAFIQPVKLQKITLWLSGYIPYLSIRDMLFEIIVIAIVGILLILEAPKLNILALGEDIAKTSGINVDVLRKKIFIYTSILTGIIVSLTGLIGFVGLIVPQMLRFMGLINNKILIPLSFFVGGSFVIMSDLFARVVSGLYGFEPPISAITAVVGCPVFVILLRDYYRERGGG
ncbi:MAG: iron ABC transporter permease [Deltaproteobacteria bacterium]|nr:iron ABC transporter permease [Deltaproteobacteria bacterium]